MKTGAPLAARPVSVGGVLRRAAQAWFRHPWFVLLTFVALLVQQLFTTGFALSLKLIIDNVINGTNEPPLALIVAGLLAAFVLVALVSIVGEQVNARMNVLILNDIRRRLHNQLQRLSADFHARVKPGDVLTAFNSDMRAAETAYTQAFLNTIVVAITLAINVPLLFQLEWRLALMLVVLLPTLLIFVSRMLPRMLTAISGLRHSETEMLNTVQETLRAHQVIRTFLIQPLITERFEQKLERMGQGVLRVRLTSALISKTSSLGVLLIQLLVMLLGATLVFYGYTGVGAFVSFMSLMGAVTNASYDFTQKTLPQLIDASSGIDSIEKLINAPISVADAPDAQTLPPFSRQIAFEHVSFGYTAASQNLKDVTLNIPCGSSVAFVGASGSGKSTALSLIMRSYDPREGRVLIDGIDMRAVTQASLRGQMSAVFQESYLFNTTIRENIRMGKLAASDAQIEAAARAAEIHDMIVAQPDGYDTLVGEGGGRLSGGQRQRIAIARAILSDPRILVLDEATSALDPGVEAAVNATLAHLAKGRTVISVTHRLQAAKRADKIFVMHDGVLVEQGAHEALLAAKGVYHALWEKQSGFDVSKDGRFARVDAERLRKITLFANLPNVALQEIARQFHPEYVEPGQTVIHQGDDGDKAYLIARGQVAISIAGANGNTQVIDTLEEGDHFGEMALLSNQPRNASVSASTPCLFLTISKDNLLALVDRFPEISAALQARMQASLRNLHAAQESAA
jgi:ATP-binding cassette, subfamily B, bacterial